MKLFALLFLFFITIACQCLAQNYSATWERIYPINSPELRRDHSMVQISENKVLMFGGDRIIYDTIDNPFNDTWIFDLKEKSWTKIDSKVQPSERYGHDVVLLDSNTVFMYGGVSKHRDDFQRDVWYFDIQKLQWEQIPIDTSNSPPEFIWWGMCKMSQDTIIIYGFDSECCDFHFYYNISQRKWFKDKKLHKLPPHTGWKFVNLNDKELFTFGGFNWNGGTKNQTWMMNKHNLDWKEVYPNDLPQKLKRYSIQKITNYDVFVFGGFTQDNFIDSCRASNQIYLFDYTKSDWFNITPKDSPKERTGHAMAKLNDSTFLMYSGVAACLDMDFEPENGTWLLHLKRNVTSFDSELISNEIEYKETQNIIQIIKLENGSTIQIFDVLGNLVEVKYSLNNPIQINKLEYPIGVYLIKIQIGNKTFTNKFIGLR